MAEYQNPKYGWQVADSNSPPIQSIFEESATVLDQIGRVYRLADGRTFIYSKAGASALAAGKMTSAAVSGGHADTDACALTSAGTVATGGVVGGTEITIVLDGSTVTYAANDLVGGFFNPDNNNGEGHQYRIKSNTAFTAGGSGTVTLCDPIRVALAASSTGTLAISPYRGTIIQAASNAIITRATGVPPIPVTALYYYWSQVTGPAVCLQGAAWVAGVGLTIDGETAGALTPMTELLFSPVLAIANRVGVDASYGDCCLCVPY